jgi:hypothetical protein
MVSQVLPREVMNPFHCPVFIGYIGGFEGTEEIAIDFGVVVLLVVRLLCNDCTTARLGHYNSFTPTFVDPLHLHPLVMLATSSPLPTTSHVTAGPIQSPISRPKQSSTSSKDGNPSLKIKPVQQSSAFAPIKAKNILDKYHCLHTQGIVHEPNSGYSPQSNGVAERLNRTLMEMIRPMLLKSKLPSAFWAEALATATYIRNRLPTKSLAFNMSPHEAWFGKILAILHLRRFGCTCPSRKNKEIGSPLNAMLPH